MYQGKFLLLSVIWCLLNFMYHRENMANAEMFQNLIGLIQFMILHRSSWFYTSFGWYEHREASHKLCCVLLVRLLILNVEWIVKVYLYYN